MSDARDSLAGGAGSWLPRRRLPLAALGALVAVVLAAGAVWLASDGDSSPRAGAHASATGGRGARAGGAGAARVRRPTGRPVDVQVDPTPTGGVVPQDFLGLSFEVGDLPRVAGFANQGDLVALMRGLGPGVMRFGGVSADAQAAWTGPGQAPPAWATSTISASDFAGLARLAAATGWRVILTVGLGHFDPARAAAEVAAARAALGSSLMAVSIGNEPDSYARRALRGGGWGFALYRGQIQAYRSAIAAAAPGVTLAGPDASSGLVVLPWVHAAATSLPPGLLTDHYYPSSSCGYTPQVSDLLDPRTRAGESGLLGALTSIARVAHLPVRMDETNDISCRGEPGVSNSFASALWATDYTLRAISAGVVGVNFHDLIGETLAYSPVAASDRSALDAGQLQAKPKYYALLLVRRLLGDRLAGARVTGGGSGLTAWALMSPQGRMHVVLVNFDPPGSTPLLVRLKAPGRFAGGQILRLTGPQPAATGGVRLGGRRVAPDGAWSASSSLPRVYGRPGGLELSVPAASAALVTLPPVGGS